MKVRGVGRAIFVAVLLLIGGTLNVIYGIAAISDSHFFVGDQFYLFSDLHTWGWITVILGGIEILAGFSLFAGGAFGRFFGIFAASIVAIGALLQVGSNHPWWALAVFAISVVCIHGLAVLGEVEVRE